LPKVLAHRERPGSKPIVVGFEQINWALAELGEVTKQFYRLRHPGEHLGMLTPIADMRFVTMFETPWYTPTWAAPDSGPAADGPESYGAPPSG
jgi:hypothetical protein